MPSGKRDSVMITDIIIKAAGNKGQGVYALRGFSKGEFIFRRRHGSIVANADIPLLPEEDQRHLCELDWQTSAILLAPGCYLNHSCDPNCEAVITRGHIWLEAIRAIPAGTELVYDYQYEDDADYTEEDLRFYACKCGAPNCRGTIVKTRKRLKP